MLISRKSIPRRSFLRGAGAALALPFLDAMVPAMALPEQRAERARRFSIVFAPNGMNMKTWTPEGTGKSYTLSPTLQPLARYRDRMLVLSGLNNDQGDAWPGEGETAPHERAGGVFLTGVHPLREGRTGISIDQIVAGELGKRTQLASLELGLHTSDAVGNCEKGWSCAYISTLSWRTPTTPLPIEYRPRAVFERLFGDSTDPSVRLARIRREKSILDSVTAATQRMKQSLGGGDRQRLSEYLDGVREVEHRIQMAERQTGDLPPMEPPTGIPPQFADHLKLMFDLQVLAFRTDMTRMITFMTGPEQSNRTYPEIGVRDVHHSLSHHRNDPINLEKLSKINLYHSELLGYYLDKLDATPDVDGSLLDNMVMLYGCSMSDGNGHTLQNLPILLLGGGSGHLRGGAHLRYENGGAPLANLFLTILDKLNIPADSFGDSNGRLDLLSLA